MFGNSGANDLGYSANAILIALIRQLIRNGLLPYDQVADLLNDASRILEPNSNIGSVAGAMRIVDDVKRRVAA